MLALLVLWYDMAFRMTLGPLYTLPVDILSHPRADASWLSALVAMTLTGLVMVLARAMRARGTLDGERGVDDVQAPFVAGAAVPGAAGAPAVPRAASGTARVSLASLIDMPSLVLALACCAGTLLVRFCSASLALTVLGGLVGGTSFALLAVRLVATAPLERSPQAILTVAGAALGVSAAVKLVFCALNVTVLGVLVSLMPPLAVLCVARARLAARTAEPVGAQPADPQPRGTRPSQFKSHLTEVGFCFFGLGLYMGVIGFANDGLAQAEYLSRQFLVGVGGTLLACALLLASKRANPDGPYVMLPILLGTSALVFVITTTVPSSAGETLAHIAGRSTDNLSTVLAACTMAELSCMAGRGGRLMSSAAVVAICSGALLVGILGGGVLMSTVGLGTTSIVLVAVSLLYGALLSLGLSVQQRARDQFVIVRNPADMARIAQVQAASIASELGNLTPRETEVLPYLLQHQGADAIAEKLGISRNTVKTHIAHIYEKAGVNTRAQLVDLAASKTVSL